MFEPGTKCVITWATEWTTCQLGEIVITGSQCWPPSSLRGRDDCYHNIGPAQDIAGRSGIDGWPVCHPVDWMLPLNPDTPIMDDMEDIKRLSDEILS